MTQCDHAGGVTQRLAQLSDDVTQVAVGVDRHKELRGETVLRGQQRRDVVRLDAGNAAEAVDGIRRARATVEDVAAGLKAFQARTSVDEVIIASSMYDHDARKRSVALAMEAARAL